MSAAAVQLAADAPGWTGAVAGFIALGVFVAFSGWIIAQRWRLKHRKDRDVC